MRSELFSADNLEKESAQPGLRLQNSKLLKAELNGDFMARVGSMVAYQGQVQFEALGSGGIGKFLKQKLTGEGVPLMRVRGQGDVFLAERASEIHLIDLEPGDALDQRRERAGLRLEPQVRHQDGQRRRRAVQRGLFNCVFGGQGRIAVTTQGTPVVLTVDQPTYVDPQAAICWSASLQTGYHKADQMGLGTLLDRSTGERFTMSFAGQGFVVVQPSEEPPGGLAGVTGGKRSSGSGVLGDLFD